MKTLFRTSLLLGFVIGFTSCETASDAPTREPLNHREAAVECDDARPPGVDEDNFGDCMNDSDCTEGRNGRCINDRGTRCTYDECLTDSECGSGSVCACGGGFHSDANACLSGNCVTDADCGDGYCSPSLGDCGDYAGPVGYFCHTPDDECVDDADCAAQGAEHCSYDQGVGRWLCTSVSCDG